MTNPGRVGADALAQPFPCAALALTLGPGLAAALIVHVDNVSGLAVLSGAAAIGAVIAGVTVGRSSAVRLSHSALVWWSIGAVSALAMAYATTPVLASISAMLLGASITRGSPRDPEFAARRVTPRGIVQGITSRASLSPWASCHAAAWPARQS
ncbi:hypothetical protein [Puniceibacterium sp. IMCC21224]|uniref:hypothetical protein n=1 Tax=Puniceibacterium sp. IMCC21224 TaxID=1618204 RepID=UPI00065CF320|nr:hypothetical protein [Puniceibacterium sp. IMCC21224]KMK65159.1 hypothetical protein IMCC21224_12404 [Puniceibacterium sp. IMCC21224]